MFNKTDFRHCNYIGAVLLTAGDEFLYRGYYSLICHVSCTCAKLLKQEEEVFKAL